MDFTRKPSQALTMLKNGTQRRTDIILLYHSIGAFSTFWKPAYLHGSWVEEQ